jgi:hypothetical protein
MTIVTLTRLPRFARNDNRQSGEATLSQYRRALRRVIAHRFGWRAACADRINEVLGQISTV